VVLAADIIYTVAFFVGTPEIIEGSSAGQPFAGGSVAILAD